MKNQVVTYRKLSRLVVLVAFVCIRPAVAANDWSHYGGDEGGSRFSAAKQITPANVDDLVPVWTFHTGHLAGRSPKAILGAKFQATPILIDNRLIVCTPFNQVIAIDPGSGKEAWRFDPKVYIGYDYVTACRGVAAWTDSIAAEGTACRQRILTGTNDARLIAIDAATGRRCEQFGVNGEVKITSETALLWPGELQITSSPVIIGDIVIVGSSISDNARVVAPHGTVRGFDVRTGAVKWTWDPIPRDPNDPTTLTWGDGWKTAGHANVWAPMSVDTKRGLVFLPTTSPSPDYFGGLRPGNNQHANSVVALNAATGALVWAYQIVHHDIWDYDTPTQPTLVTLDLNDGKRDVVIQATKQGFIFVLDRDTGAPVFPVEEKAVPQNGAAGEWLSPTQPMPTHVPALVPQRITPDQAYGITPWDRGKCRDAIAAARSEGLYTPPSEQGTIEFPMSGGGVNWGGVAFDAERQILYTNTSRFINLITLFAADRFAEFEHRYPDKEVAPQTGAPFGMKREFLLSPLGLPCNPPPWGTLTAVDLKAGKILWESPVGTTEEHEPLGIARNLGFPVIGGSIVTASGLVFIGSTLDRYLRAFDAQSGRELWQGRLPSTTQATPMTYEWRGRQYLVIAVGGRLEAGAAADDSIVAFALPGPNESGPTLWSRTIDRPGGRFKLKLAIFAIGLSGVATLIVTRRRKLKSRSH
jgi:quinoprotein glucose dehydrogenase